MAPRPCVLIVDDDEPLLETIAAILADDYEVVACSSGEKALQLFDPERFVVAVADYQLPGISGLQVLERIMGRTKSTCCLLMTAAADFYATAASKGDRPPVIFKPFRPDSFLKTVGHLCRIAQMKRSTKALRASVQRVQDEVRAAPAMRAAGDSVAVASERAVPVEPIELSATGDEPPSSRIARKKPRR